MVQKVSTQGRGGVLIKIKAFLERNRLGELLVLNGSLTPQELRYALVQQRVSKEQLGRVLLEQKLLTRRALYRTLGQQWTLRCLAALFTFMITFSGSPRDARAGVIKDMPAQFRLVAQNDGGPVNKVSLFGSGEKRSSNIGPFTKWSDMFARFERAAASPGNQDVIQNWQDKLKTMTNLSLEDKIRRVNSMVNSYEYILDNRNWGKSDYWSTPVEFFKRGGDCEDFAITKYMSLRALGVSEDRLRIAIVHDLQKDIPHAVLIVYTDTDALILDNQTDQVRSSVNMHRYKPIFSINRTAWWLHSPQSETVVASR